MKYRHVMIMGAGAVGGYFGGRIAERTHTEVSFIARGGHLSAIRERGLEIRSPNGDSVVPARAYEDPAEAPSPDLVIMAVKSYDTEAAIGQIQPVVTDNNQVLTIQNGIENYGKLKEAFGEARVIPGLCRIGASILKPGVIEHQSLGSIVVGEPDGEVTARVSGIEALFEDTGVDFKISPDIRHEIWVKFAWNSIFNMVTGIGLVPVDALFENLYSEQLCYDLFGEIAEVAASVNVALTAEDAERVIEGARKLRGFTTSTYNDREKGKKLEYEAFTGALVRLADRYGIAIPRNRTMYALLRVID